MSRGGPLPTKRLAAAKSIAVWASWPQAWIAQSLPSILKGSASMSARSSTTGPGSVPRMMPTTPVVPPTFVCVSIPSA